MRRGHARDRARIHRRPGHRGTRRIRPRRGHRRPVRCRHHPGTIVNRKQLDRILGYIEKGRNEGAELLTGGARVGEKGFFVQPTVFRGTNDLTIAREEIFGPVATVITFKTTEEAVRLANATQYGLNAFIFSQSLSTVHSVIPQLRVGTVWVNGWGVPDPALPWGGRDASGIGRELGRSGLEAFTEEKTVHLGY